MPNKRSAKKAIRQDDKKYEHNKIIRDNIKYLFRKRRKFITDKKLEEAESITKKLISKIDRASQKKILKKNNASRKKSRLMSDLLRS